MQIPEAIGEVLIEREVEAFFGLVGSGNFTVINALRAAGAEFYSARHECGAIMMADGYARASGKVGICSVFQGPGFTNTLTGLAEAVKNCTPLVVLAADTPAETLTSNFKIDQASLAATLGAIVERVHEPASAAEDTARALWRTHVEGRPVVLNIPTNITSMPYPGDPTAVSNWPPLESPRPSRRSVAEVADLLESSDRPVILAGRGAGLSGARGELEALGEQIGALLATSAMGKGVFSGNPYAIGIAGGFSSPLAAELLYEADVVLAFGASLNQWTTRQDKVFSSAARVVQIDLDAQAIGKLHRTDIGILGDAAATAQAITEELKRRSVRKHGSRTEETTRRISSGHWRDEPYKDSGTAEYIDPRTLSIALDDLLPLERTLATDSGHFFGYPAMYMDVPDQQGFIFTTAFGSVGLGLASGIGASVARPDRLCVTALGDGGALMALGELETAARYRLPMLIVIYNDAAYGAETHLFAPTEHPLDLTRFPETDFAALARAAGAEGITVRATEDLMPIKEWLGRRSGPLVIDAKINPHVQADWIEDARRAH